MSSQIGCILGDGDIVPETDGNLAIAPRAHVWLGGLVGLNTAHLDGTEGPVPDPGRLS